MPARGALTAVVGLGACCRQVEASWRDSGGEGRVSRAAGAGEPVEAAAAALTSRHWSCTAGPLRRGEAAVAAALLQADPCCRHGRSRKKTKKNEHAALCPCRLAVVVYVLFFPAARAHRLPFGGPSLQQIARTCHDRVARRVAAAPRPCQMHLPPGERRGPARASLLRRTDEDYGWAVATERTMVGRCRRWMVKAHRRRR